MHIELTLKVAVCDETRIHVMEELRRQLRKQAEQFVFEAAESAGIYHRGIEIDGDILLVGDK